MISILFIIAEQKQDMKTINLIAIFNLDPKNLVKLSSSRSEHFDVSFSQIRLNIFTYSLNKLKICIADWIHKAETLCTKNKNGPVCWRKIKILKFYLLTKY